MQVVPEAAKEGVVEKLLQMMADESSMTTAVLEVCLLQCKTKMCTPSI